MRAIDSVLARLQARGVGVPGTTLFKGTGADLSGAGAIVTVTETGGQKPVTTHRHGSIKQPSFQVVARNAEYKLAEAKIDQAYLALGGQRNGVAYAPIANVLIGDVFWLFIRPSSEPFTLAVDGQGRSRLAFNIDTAWR